jgi:hypothetical protein
MPSMTLARSTLAAAVALALGAVAPAALAETGGPQPQGYPTDGSAPPIAALPPVQQVPDAAQPGVDGDGDPDQFADADPSALTDFQQPLAPYGQWTQDPTYGTLWVPDPAQVGADFAPYQTAGQWATDDAGDWLWQSDYAWGYIPFHYGRWVWAGNNWGWIPGRRYAPAWVTWRVGQGGYVGWAPLPPTWYWGGGRAIALRSTPFAAYCFVPTNYAFARGVSAWVVRDRGMIQTVAATTRPYHPATPTAGGQPASPRFSEAHIPASAVPRVNASADPRAMRFATRSATAGRAPPTLSAGSAGRASGYTRWWSSARSVGRAPSEGLRTPGQGGGYSHAQREPYYGSHAEPSYHMASPSFHASAPAARPQASRPAQSYVPPPAVHVAPARSGGGRRR